MLSNILAPLADGGKSQWPPSGVEPALTLWYEAVGRIRVQLMHWMDKQSKHIAVSCSLTNFSIFPCLLMLIFLSFILCYHLGWVSIGNSSFMPW